EEGPEHRRCTGAFSHTRNRRRPQHRHWREGMDLIVSRAPGLDSGELKVHEKGDVERTARLSPRVQRLMREYLARQPRGPTTGQHWVSKRGEKLSDWGAHMVRTGQNA